MACKRSRVRIPLPPPFLILYSQSVIDFGLNLLGLSGRRQCHSSVSFILSFGWVDGTLGPMDSPEGLSLTSAERPVTVIGERINGAAVVNCW